MNPFDKNRCENCQHFEMNYGCDSDGYNTWEEPMCYKRGEDTWEKMNDPKYRAHPKRCFERAKIRKN